MMPNHTVSFVRLFLYFHVCFMLSCSNYVCLAHRYAKFYSHLFKFSTINRSNIHFEFIFSKDR